MQVSIEAYSSEILTAIASVRTSVFVQEQGIPASIDFDGQDQHAVHALARMHGKCIGTARMLPDGHIGRVAVLKEFRHAGVGRAIITAVIAYARSHQYSRVYLAAQESAVSFYVKLGFSIVGPSYLEAGIRHCDMQLNLSDTLFNESN